MNASTAGTEQLVAGIVEALDGGSADVDVLICPPFPYIAQAQGVLAAQGAGDRVKLGAQDLDVNESGAFTGAVSGLMLNDCGCAYVLVGHSERRSLYADSDELVAQKTKAAVKHGLVPVVCIGETLEEREQNQTEAVLKRQIDAVLNTNGVDVFAGALIAYEPVWAIGTGKTASPQQAQESHAYIRGLIGQHNSRIADNVRILYGGSVKGENAAGLFSQTDIDGGLIGGASLKATDFIDIVKAV